MSQTYQLAGLKVTSDYRLPFLPVWASTPLDAQSRKHDSLGIACAKEFPYATVRAPLGMRVRTVNVAREPDGYSIEVEAAGTFWVCERGTWIHVEPEPSVDLEGPAFLDAVLGPPLVLALALRGIWALHASAALIDGKLVAFTADSGTGKSTLAHALDHAGARRVADDILPVTLDESGAYGWPHFPQLKLPSNRQPSLGLPERLPLHAIYTLDGSVTPGTPFTPVTLSPRHATAALVRHTVATRLFDPPLLRRHLDFAAQMAQAVRVSRLPYPRRFDSLPAVITALYDDLTT